MDSIELVKDKEQFLSALEGSMLRGADLAWSRYFSHGDYLEIVRKEIESRLCSGSVAAFMLCRHGDVKALCLCSKLDWDSGYFGREMARLDFYGGDELSVEDIAGILRSTLDYAVRDCKFDHVLCKVSSFDYELVNAILSLGAFLADIQNIYIARRSSFNVKRGLSYQEKNMYLPRPYRKEDEESLLRLLSKVSFSSRYTRDATLPKDKVERMYEAWISNILASPDSSREVFVLERYGEIVAVGAGRYVDFLVNGVRKKILTDGLFASVRGYSGAYLTVTKTVVRAGIESGCGLVELKVSNSNRAANRALQSLGYENSAQFHAFHITP